MENSVKQCTHTDSERMFTGTWTTLDLNKALEKGYTIDKIYEVCHFSQKSNNLFKDYIRDFMRIKLETSPHSYESNEAYALVIKQQMNIELELEKIKPNPGKRAIVKICLNSYCGVNYKYKDLFYEDSISTNIFVASFTTSNARLRLYSMLDKLGENVVYYDTDSIIYIDDGCNTVETGEMLGEWTDELGEEDHIVDFLSTGPKSYYYKTLKGKNVTNIKFFTLNYENSEVLNNKGMLEVINNPSSEIN
ncbi:unnamed protein product [Psylliodes chrysocephalus]|uniref:DNA-directed DNA polymerase n=1 Tax=Psylliodes chrysocephalus TaxID=3402493 RepID=A0A9P0CRT7_9CUCU|nr:unnamed protein product [Psylliodes chrysocephala]